jgi:hypothetical protein
MRAEGIRNMETVRRIVDGQQSQIQVLSNRLAIAENFISEMNAAAVKAARGITIPSARIVTALALRALPWEIGKKLMTKFGVQHKKPDTGVLVYHIALKNLIIAIWQGMDMGEDDGMTGTKLPTNKRRFLKSFITEVFDDNVLKYEITRQRDSDYSGVYFESFVLVMYYKDREAGGRSAYEARGLFGNLEGAGVLMTNIENAVEEEAVFGKYDVMPVVINDTEDLYKTVQLSKHSQFNAKDRRMGLPKAEGQGWKRKR